jgi:YidC/Oxa1 family membrane protein insertase
MSRPTTSARTRLLTLLAVLVAALLLFAIPVAAETPSPGASGPSPSAAPAAGAAGTPAATPKVPPCPDKPPPPASPEAGPTQSPRAVNLCPAQPDDPFNTLAWLFTPLFQALFLALAASYRVLGDIGLAIVAVTLLIRLLLFPVFRRQIVSQRRMQLLQPEITALRQKFKGDRQKIQEETMRLYKERGVSLFGCLPLLLTLVPLLALYSVFSSGLTAPDISSMLQVFGVPVIDVPCQDPANALRPCIDPTVRWLGNLNASQPRVEVPLGISLFGIPIGISILAVLSALLQLVQTKMMAPQTNDPQVRAQQRIFLFLPVISVFYGTILPAGLFIYWIVTTIFSIVQQYLIAGWGSLFPLFGWNPSFARDHRPRFAPSIEPLPTATAGAGAGAGGAATPTRRISSTDRAAGTVRPAKTRGRTSRRGRRR